MSEPARGSSGGPPKLRAARQETSDDGARVRLIMDTPPPQWGGVIELAEPITGDGRMVVFEVVWPAQAPIAEPYTLPRGSVITNVTLLTSQPPPFPFPLAEPAPPPVMVTRPCGCTSMDTGDDGPPVQVSWCVDHDPGYEP